MFLITSVLAVTVISIEIFATTSLDLCSTDKLLERYYAKNKTAEKCGCENCLRICCKPGYVYARNFCNRQFNDILNVTLYTDKTIFVQEMVNFKNFQVGLPNCPRLFRINSSVDELFIQTDYTVWIPKYAKFVSSDSFCVDENEGFTIIKCFPQHKENGKVSRIIGMLISMPFLLATFLVYVILPDSSIHKRALMFYVLTLLLAYICLVTVQLRRSDSTPIADVPCKMLGYSIIFFFIVSFCWLNVMCIDMWLAFSGLTRFAASKTAETKRFLYYCAYAWGTPLILILIIFLLNRMENTRSIFHPRLGIGKCFIEDGYPNLFYFYLPMAILITINIVLFTLTALKIQQVKRETLVLKQNDSKRHTYEDDKQKFNLYLKLMLAMGINWTTEVISWLINWQTSSFPTEVWYVTDFANAAYGAFIFFIFVFKKKIWIQLKKRYYILMGKPHRAHALSTTSGARSSGMSTTVTHLHQSEIRMNNLHNRTNDERPLREN